MSEEFLKQTAKDYCLSLDKVRFISVNFTNEFYEKLEEELKLSQAQ